jgi:hypothetical protein
MYRRGRKVRRDGVPLYGTKRGVISDMMTMTALMKRRGAERAAPWLQNVTAGFGWAHHAPRPVLTYVELKRRWQRQ